MKLFFYLPLFLCFPALAEYRVYQYFIQSKDNYPTKPKSYVVTSALNPVSYRAYHGGTSLQIDLVRSWYCPGYTGDSLPPCEGPNEKMAKSGGPNEN